MSEKTFEAPAPGTWELDTTHFYRPVSLFASSAFPKPTQRGFKEGTARYGLLFSHTAGSMQHGFAYSKLIMAFAPDDAPPGPPPEGYFEMPEMQARLETGEQAIANRIWREDLKLWDEEIKPDSIRRNDALQAVDPAQLDSPALIQHIIDCHENLAEMWYRHHKFTIGCLIPIGLYLGHAGMWAGIPVNEALALLKGSTPVSLGVAAPQLKIIGKELNAAGFDVSSLDGLPAQEALDRLRSVNGTLTTTIDQYLDLVGYQLTSGYDITEKYLLETPEILVTSILTAMDKINEENSSDEALNIIRGKIPAQHADTFDEYLAEARLINRLRDERGVYNEARANGISRRAVKTAGERLVAEGRLPDAELMVFASVEEMTELLNGSGGEIIEALKERQNWFQTMTTDDVPSILGSPAEPPPPLEALPEKARLGQLAIGAAIGNVFDPPEVEKPAGIEVQGYPVSAGVYEGYARIINGPDDFKRIQKGDVLITKNTSASFNVVLPIIGALVTDRGGQLSHAAIVAREYGIPGIVSTRNGTRVVPDGARVRVDGISGSLEVLS